MRPALKTIADATAGRAHFGQEPFTKRDWRSWNPFATRIETLAIHGLVSIVEPEVIIEHTYTPKEFLDFVRSLFGEDLYDYYPDLRYDEAQNVYQIVRMVPRYCFT